jgi:putative lipoprotein
MEIAMTPSALAAALLIGVSPIADAPSGPERLVTVQAELPSLTGTEWDIFEIGGRLLVVDPLPQIAFFEENAFSAGAGCNRFSGSYMLDGTSIDFPDKVAGTMMACEPPLDRLEADMIEAIISSTAVVPSEAGLALTNDAGVTVLRMRPAE